MPRDESPEEPFEQVLTEKRPSRNRALAVQVEEQILATSGDNRTILMHAAKCGDQLCMLAVGNACRKAIDPAKVRNLGHNLLPCN